MTSWPESIDEIHAPAQGWSYGIPSPPQIIVPAPPLDDRGRPDLYIDQDLSYDYESSGFKNVEFLKTVTYGNFITDQDVFEWRYEQRHMAQAILPFLYLGPVSIARNANFLQTHGITMVLAVRIMLTAGSKFLRSSVATDLGIQAKSVDVAGNHDLVAAFPSGIEMINEHLSDRYHAQQRKIMQGTASKNQMPGKVLVFCETGNDRSASFVTAYIMAMYSMPFIKAIQIVQAQRFAATFDDSTRTLLQTYGTILQAKRDVIQASPDTVDSSQGLSHVSRIDQLARDAAVKAQTRKRTLDEVYEEAMEVDGNDEAIGWDESDRRDGHAPFKDRYAP